MKKTEADKARKKLVTKIRRDLKAGKKKVRQISDETGYTTARIYQIQGAMRAAGELQ